MYDCHNTIHSPGTLAAESGMTLNSCSNPFHQLIAGLNIAPDEVGYYFGLLNSLSYAGEGEFILFNYLHLVVNVLK